MGTREKLIELLNDSFDEQYSKRGLLTAPHTADHLIANGVTVQDSKLVEIDQFNKWIPVTERLPEIDQPCLCYKKRKGHTCYQLGTYIGASFSEDCAAFKSMSHYGCIGITHWMPLPEPYKEDDHGNQT